MTIFRLAGEPGTQLRVLGGDAGGAGVQVAHPHHAAAKGHQGCGGKAELLGAQHTGDGHVPAGHQLAVGLQDHLTAQAVGDQRLMGFRHAQLPGQTSPVDGASGGGTGAAVMAGDEDHLGAGLGDAGGDGANARFADQLHADAGAAVGVFQIVDQLGQVLDGVDVVVGRRGDQRHAGGGAAGLGDPGIDLLAGQMSALAGLCALGHLDLDLLGAAQVFAGDAEAAGGHLLDGGAPLVVEPLRGLAALAGVGLAADAVHGDSQALMGLLGNGAVAHGASLEAVDDGADRLHLVDGDAAVFIERKVQQTPQGVGLVAGSSTRAV